jgi:hypothetical protein
MLDSPQLAQVISPFFSRRTFMAVRNSRPHFLQVSLQIIWLLLRRTTVVQNGKRRTTPIKTARTVIVTAVTRICDGRQLTVLARFSENHVFKIGGGTR